MIQPKLVVVAVVNVAFVIVAFVPRTFAKVAVPVAFKFVAKPFPTWKLVPVADPKLRVANFAIVATKFVTNEFVLVAFVIVAFVIAFVITRLSITVFVDLNPVAKKFVVVAFVPVALANNRFVNDAARDDNIPVTEKFVVVALVNVAFSVDKLSILEFKDLNSDENKFVVVAEVIVASVATKFPVFVVEAFTVPKFELEVAVEDAKLIPLPPHVNTPFTFEILVPPM